MNIQNYLLCILYIILIITHSYTLCQKDFHRNLISIFSFALFTQTLSTILFTSHQVVLTYGQHLQDLTSIDFSPVYNIHYFAQLIHVTSINFFILFLLIVAKGWPITRREMPFKYAFAVFWLLCLAADLITFYWTTITLLAKNFTTHYSNHLSILATLSTTTTTTTTTPSTTSSLNSTFQTTVSISTTTTSPISAAPSSSIPNSIIESLPKDTETFNSTPRRLSLLLRIVIMFYFLLELRTTMILEQEQKKLQFYLHFGALSMVWFVHSLIVYVISLRVEIVWQSKLISGFSSAANFLAFAITTRLLWPKSSRSYLFRKQKRLPRGALAEENIDNLSPLNGGEDDEISSEYDGLQMRNLGGGNKYMTNDSSNNHTNSPDNDNNTPLTRGSNEKDNIPKICVESSES